MRKKDCTITVPIIVKKFTDSTGGSQAVTRNVMLFFATYHHYQSDYSAPLAVGSSVR
jgi:hypothetical protein